MRTGLLLIFTLLVSPLTRACEFALMNLGNSDDVAVKYERLLGLLENEQLAAMKEMLLRGDPFYFEGATNSTGKQVESALKVLRTLIEPRADAEAFKTRLLKLLEENTREKDHAFEVVRTVKKKLSALPVPLIYPLEEASTVFQFDRASGLMIAKSDGNKRIAVDPKTLKLVWELELPPAPEWEYKNCIEYWGTKKYFVYLGEGHETGWLGGIGKSADTRINVPADWVEMKSQTSLKKPNVEGAMRKVKAFIGADGYKKPIVNIWKGDVQNYAFTGDGERLFIARTRTVKMMPRQSTSGLNIYYSEDTQVQVVDAASGKLLGIIELPRSGSPSLHALSGSKRFAAFSPKLTHAPVVEHELRIYDLDSWDGRSEIKPESVISLGELSNGPTYAIGGDGSIAWTNSSDDWVDGKIQVHFKRPDGSTKRFLTDRRPFTLAISEDGSKIAMNPKSSGFVGEVFDIESGERIGWFGDEKDGGWRNIEVSNDGKTIYTRNDKGLAVLTVIDRMPEVE